MRRWDITDNIIGRISFSKTEAPPPYSSMYATTSVNAPGNPSYLGYVATASSGNPQLKPLTSDNFDASVEWYYGKNSYVSLGYYRKAVDNFIGTGVVNSTLFGLTDPSSGKGRHPFGHGGYRPASLGGGRQSKRGHQYELPVRHDGPGRPGRRQCKRRRRTSSPL